MVRAKRIRDDIKNADILFTTIKWGDGRPLWVKSWRSGKPSPHPGPRSGRQRYRHCARRVRGNSSR